MVVDLARRLAPLIALLMLAGCTGTDSGPAPSHSPTELSSPLVINSDVGEILRPAPDAHAALTAEQAWLNYARKAGHPQSHIPARLRVVLGRLTLPPQFSARLVWAYGYGPIGCLTTLPTATTPIGIEWTFLDANNGRMLEGTCQQT
jgi:hypothetical protein